MGVQGLTTYIETNQGIYQDVHFMGHRLVIDGCNLLHKLYYNSGLDQIHGGDYAAFEALVERFVASLRRCSITAFVLLDGGTDHTGIKSQTWKSRASEKIKRACQAMAEGVSQNILPQMAELVFTQTLARLGVALAQCYTEADQQVAALANEWQCPVLSSDSDFFIFDLQDGYLPLSHFQWEKEEGGFIPCKKYNVSSFCTFSNIQRPLLPAFAVLAGNDYVNLHRLETPIWWKRFCPTTSRTPGHKEGLLCWLRGFQKPQEALKAALGLIVKQSSKKKEEVVKALNLGMEEYRVPPSAMKEFFNHNIVPPFPVVELAALVPDWIRRALVGARLTSHILDVLLLHQMSLSIPVDSAHMPSANLPSRPLRQVMYGLLLAGGPACSVQEFDRGGMELVLTPVQPTSSGATNQLQLRSLEMAGASQRLQVLLAALGVTEAQLSRLPPQLRLPVAVTCYWLKTAAPPGVELLKALLLVLSCGDPLSAELFAQEQPGEGRPDVGVAHAFSQWQACLKYSIYLNQLLCFPLPEPQVARLYEGTLVHHLVHRLRTGQLKINHSLLNQYKTTLAAVRQFLADEVARASGVPEVARAPQPQDNPPLSLQHLFLQLQDDGVAGVSSAGAALEDLHLDQQE